ncbi:MULTISPECIES: OmpA family protein [unclassified Salinivibrio]|uniref:OmpA family protein n=1 Tax=unclassified Salinivibrio TaxID=2636825 RepID=UPI0009CD5D71|nr:MULTISPECIES: OmpA family protein [unclassified Salinivibrio]OOF14684.1 hypothetical protein BZG83_05355 [Salinivibrio sp. PR919]OOF14801.1 hypothetical protein BZG84_13620 [Salinivibrio sp. PR932]
MMRVLFYAVCISLLSGCGYAIMAPPVALQKHDVADADKDGVINARDRCEQTPIGAIVDNQGCPSYVEPDSTVQASETPATSLRVLFANDTAKVSPDYVTDITAMADFLTQYPGVSVRLTGHASAIGSPEYNLRLSRERARSVRAELVSAGIDPNRIDIDALGEALATQTDPNAPQDRRVSAELLNFKGDVEKAWTIFTRRPQ